MRRAQAIFALLVFLVIGIMVYRGLPMSDLLTLLEMHDGAPVTEPTGSTGAPGGAANEAPVLPCASYREHRKTVNETLAIPRLTEKGLPLYPVLQVTDGDTIVVDNGARTRVRLLGMDTPERTKTRNGQIEYFGEEAYLFAESLIEASDWQVRLTYDQTRQDQYGRDLAYVWLKDGRMLNAVMVAEGYAYSYTASPKPQYVDLFLGLMREAREHERGLWAVCE